jgi:hypothetical protein
MRERPRKGWKGEVEEDLNVLGVKKQAGSGQRPLGMDEDCVGSQGTGRSIACEEEEEKKKKKEEEEEKKKKKKKKKKNVHVAYFWESMFCIRCT